MKIKFPILYSISCTKGGVCWIYTIILKNQSDVTDAYFNRHVL